MPSMRRRSLLRTVLTLLVSAGSFLPVRLVRARGLREPVGGMNEDMGGMMGGGMSDMMGPMRTGMELFRRHNQIRRSVTFLPDGIRAVTESEDPEVVVLIQKHVASMYERLDQDRPFAYPMSRTVPILFRNIGRYRRQLQPTAKGITVIETSDHADMVKVIKAHAQEISGFVDEGMPAMMRGMMQ